MSSGNLHLPKDQNDLFKDKINLVFPNHILKSKLENS